MSILSELISLVESLKIPVETGIFSGVPPDEYVVITPLADSFDGFADNLPEMDVQEVRLSLFSKGNYMLTKNHLTGLLLSGDFLITDRRYIGYEESTGYHNVAIDVAKLYKFGEE